jgi:1,2-diacylglycerol 3-alpha-glucosyltransferase
VSIRANQRVLEYHHSGLIDEANRMNILFLTGTYSPSVNGVAVSVESLSDELEKLGHTVTVFAPDNHLPYNHKENIIRYASITNPIVKDYPIPLLPWNRDIHRVLTTSKFDVVHVHHPFHFAWYGRRYAQRFKAPFVFTYHTRYHEYARLYLKAWQSLVRVMINMNLRYVFRHADMVIAPSAAIKKELLENFEIKRVEVLPTGVKIECPPNSTKQALRKELGFPEDRVLLLSLSRLAPEKNIELAVRSLSHLPENFFLVIAGGGSYLKRLQTLVEAEGLTERVKFLGKVEHTEVAKVYSAVDIFLFPSVTETQGINLLEAMCCGLPVVAVKSEVSTEWVPSDTGVLTENSPEGFAQAVLSISDNLGESVSSSARGWASNFTIRASAERLINLYGQFLI